jgi:hypothetical protein
MDKRDDSEKPQKSQLEQKKFEKIVANEEVALYNQKLSYLK